MTYKTANQTISRQDYPLLEKHPELIKSIKGTPLEQITMEHIVKDNVDFDDCKIHHDTLIYQAEIAEASGNAQMGQNFRRAAELTAIPDEFILRTYNAIRPYRACREEILEIIHTLETEYKAYKTAEFIREALSIIEKNHQLKEHAI